MANLMDFSLVFFPSGSLLSFNKFAFSFVTAVVLTKESWVAVLMTAGIPQERAEAYADTFGQ